MRALALGGVLTALVLSPVPAAQAAGPAGWQQISTFAPGSNYPGMRNIDHPTIGRLGTGLNVIWTTQTTPGTQAYQGAILDANGRVAAPAADLIANWSTLTSSPRFISVGGQPFLSFSGLQSTNTGAPYTTGAAYYATSADGRAWSLGPGSMSATTSAYADYGMDAIDVNGTPMWAGNPGTTTGLTWHLGVSPTDPAPAGSDGSIQVTGCCAYSAALARDDATGAVFGAFYSNSSNPAEQGIQVAQIHPTVGAPTQAPGSTVARDGSANSLSPDQRIAMIGRPGGAVLVAYKSGYPTTNAIRVWQVGTPTAIRIPGSANATRVAMAAGPDGTAWVAWTTSDHVKIVRIKDGRVVPRSTIAWARPPKSSSLWSIAASSGAAKRLDVVISATGPGSTIQVYSRQARIR